MAVCFTWVTALHLCALMVREIVGGSVCQLPTASHECIMHGSRERSTEYVRRV